MQNIEEVRHKIEWWSSYVEQHERIYSSCHMNNAWHKRMANIKQNIFNWRMKEIEMVQNNPSLYRRKTKLIENLLNQLEYHQCEKERIVRKAYAGKEELDFSMVNHHQREVLLLAEEIHFEFLKGNYKPNSVVFNAPYDH